MSDTPNPSIEDVLDDIPEEYRDRFNGLLSEPTIPIDKMKAYVVQYLATVKQVGLMVKLLDMGQAEALATTALTLLDSIEPTHPASVKLLVQAAVSYFVFEEEDDEITGVLGFDDDVHVLNAVSRALGRDDLIVRVNRQD